MTSPSQVSGPSSAAGPLRKQPRQARGQQRIDRILDAAAELFGSDGYEATTTNAIAGKAQTSIGSLYQFFPNKEAVLHALADRYLTELRSIHERVFTAETARLPLEAMTDRIIDTLADFHARHPGFRPLFYGSTTSVHLGAAAEQLQAECIRRVEGMWAARRPDLPAADRRLHATVCVVVTKALLNEASADPTQRGRLLAESKAVLLRYTAPLDRVPTE